MRRAALVVFCVFAVGLVLSGCGTKAPGIPGTVATVNGKSIPASIYLDQISHRYGQDVLRNLIEQQIILQWAADEKVPPSQEQIEKQIDILKREGTYEDQAKMMGEGNMKSEIEAMQARANLAGKFTKVTDQQLKQTYDQMKQRYVHGVRKQITLILNPNSSKLDEALKQLKEGKDFEKVSAEFTDARFSMRGPIKLWIDESQPGGMPPALLKATKETKVGQTSGIVSFGQPMGPTQSAIIKVLQEQPKQNLTLKDVKPEIENMAALQSSQMDPGFVGKLNAKMKEAKIEVGIEEFKGLVNGFKNPPEPSPMMVSPPRHSSGPSR